MNLRNWSKEHTLGLLLGIVTTIVFIPILLLLFSAFDNRQLWFLNDTKAKIISLASIANLGWFHLFIKKQKYNYAMGLIIATIISFSIMLYYKS